MLDDLTMMEIQTLARWIIQQGIPTQGPLLATSLLRTAQRLREKAVEVIPEEDNDVRKLINRYADCYETIGMIEGTSAGGALDLLKELLRKDQ